MIPAIQSCDAKRLRKRERQKKKRNQKGLIIKKKNNNFARAAHFLFHISLPLLLQCETSELNILWRKCRMCSQKTFAACVPVRLLFFSPLLIFTLLAAGISHFLTVAI